MSFVEHYPLSPCLLEVHALFPCVFFFFRYVHALLLSLTKTKLITNNVAPTLIAFYNMVYLAVERFQNHSHPHQRNCSGLEGKSNHPGFQEELVNQPQNPS